jgi:hypothetical protein
MALKRIELYWFCVRAKNSNDGAESIPRYQNRRSCPVLIQSDSSHPPARDYEVMVSESIDPLLKQHPDRSELRLLASDFKHERDQGYAVAKAAVANTRYRHIVLDAALWRASRPPR